MIGFWALQVFWKLRPGQSFSKYSVEADVEHKLVLSFKLSTVHVRKLLIKTKVGKFRNFVVAQKKKGEKM